MKADEQQRLERYFEELERLIPNPPRGWQAHAKPCKWLKILQERKIKNPDATG